MRIRTLAKTFVTLNIADALLTAWAIHTGGGEVQEGLPVMALLVSQGLGWFLAVKILVGTLLAFYCWRFYHQRELKLGILLLVAVLTWNVLRLWVHL